MTNPNDLSFATLQEAEDFEIESQRILGEAGIQITESSHDGIWTLINERDEAIERGDRQKELREETEKYRDIYLAEVNELKAALRMAQIFNDNLRARVALKDPLYQHSSMLKIAIEKVLDGK